MKTFNGKKWPLGAEGLQKYIDIHMFHRLRTIGTRASLFARPFVCSVMSRNRFQTISQCLHISDPGKDAEMDNKTIQDRICQGMNLWSPQKQQNGLKNYLRFKPSLTGHKLFALVHLANDYTYNFKVYSGKEDFPAGQGLSFDSVISLLDSVSFSLGQGYNIYCDSYHTSPQLFQELSRRKVKIPHLYSELCEQKQCKRYS